MCIRDRIVDLIGNEKAYGEAFHITTEESHTWREILYFYCDVIEKKTGKRPKVKIVDNSYNLQKVWNKWQIKYDRLYNREFDNSKIESIRGHYEYKDTFKGLEECLNEFLEHPIWIPSMNVKYEAYCDRITGAVSYTHLDVYKRQGYGDMSSRIDTLLNMVNMTNRMVRTVNDIESITCECTFETAKKIIDKKRMESLSFLDKNLKSVSYTHLDVYKRQV